MPCRPSCGQHNFLNMLTEILKNLNYLKLAKYRNTNFVSAKG